MQILVLTVGRPKEKCLEELVLRYLSRLGNWRAEWRWVRPSAQGLKELRLQEEAERLKRHITPEDYLVILDERGEEFDSVRFTSWLQGQLGTRRRTVFVVGGADGVSIPLLGQAHLRLRLSAMTLQHEIALLVLAEQLYRAFTLLIGHPYHR
ncbi:MAG: 23S rRNA (pseudouridine(1915)-N(3))-methyltransferase RlmH [candidate division KSB1 bacterium]|nr:23S rRNA (pseudouridine(1915)-N(3))-methyltransferase RlmH [candidate division KSB1 bacterium]